MVSATEPTETLPEVQAAGRSGGGRGIDVRFIDPPGGADSGHLALILLDSLITLLAEQDIISPRELADIVADRGEDLDASKLMLARRMGSFIEGALERLRAG
jgi:hypothetical protein